MSANNIEAMKQAFINNRNEMYENALKLDAGRVTSSSIQDWHAFNNSIKKMSILNWAMGKEISVTHSLSRSVINEMK